MISLEDKENIRDIPNIQNNRILQENQQRHIYQILQDNQSLQGNQILQENRNLQGNQILQDNQNLQGNDIFQENQSLQGNQIIQENQIAQANQNLQGYQALQDNQIFQDNQSIQENHFLQGNQNNRGNQIPQDKQIFQGNQSRQDSQTPQDSRNLQDNRILQDSKILTDKQIPWDSKILQDNQDLWGKQILQNSSRDSNPIQDPAEQDQKQGLSTVSSSISISLEPTNMNQAFHKPESHLTGTAHTSNTWKPSLDVPTTTVLNNAAVLAAHPCDRPNPVVYLDISVGAVYMGRLIIDLFENVAPRTCRNFLQLCRGDQIPSASGGSLPGCYKGSGFHRLVPRFLIQGGDIRREDPSTTAVDRYFEDENFLLKHETAGQVAMANGGAPNTGDGAQFFITTAACPHLDDKHVVFGLVRRGLGILQELAALQTDAEDRPLVPVTILDCGEILPGDSLGKLTSLCKIADEAASLKGNSLKCYSSCFSSISLCILCAGTY
jgi:cyclophilin family peptidyl-prolyl cis-trans isomerase